MNNNKLILAIFSLFFLLTLGIGVFVLAKSTHFPPNSSTTKTLLPDSTGVATAYLEADQEKSPNLNKIDIIFHDTLASTSVVGFSFDVKISPGSFTVNGSSISPSQLFTTHDFSFPLRNVVTNPDGILFSLAGIRINPGANILLKNGDILATLTLAEAKSGKYSVAIDNTTSSVLNQNNINLIKPAGIKTITL